MPEKSQTKKIFRLRPKAESDLENIYAYSYKEFGLMLTATKNLV
jgi:plasmid stabilization system protein ParE